MAKLAPAKEKQDIKPAPQSGANEKEPELKGAFASVMILGAFILITWFGVFALYLIRS
ncbi:MULTISPECIES: cytochrome c oxidase subunit 2A [Paenibacillus]|uniref:Cytochrome c oxidase subunit 2A n=1 Tax=Paenibacillus chitinolyticus TaxID=79263 RepID=A0A410WUY4_9BACL|nr:MULTISPECIES: cytochrome c oxidase subunit 2A [Paenibacillus]EGL13069.1 cytochrome c oxidase subunit IIa family [Paenibacillus sp. HGF7]EPD80604.1 hypothetical protein HMPREF1207_04360 [Paenibacillus sp. HGH0039]MCY9589545.1 cytochrome c oxidase subunit 2A [Paenibacillus chitinolyticus]MCY9599177.1 cytochrome c oxidase subunit 2A [Paenibacillus chitinolyticus]MEC0246992.1 cytochrome c oxidase subunit 2A [Paenibacillus chitinolyticus]